MIDAKRCIFLQICLSLVAFATLLVAPPDLDASMAISPSITEISAYPGGQQSFFFSVVNNSDTVLNCEISASAMTVVSGGLPVAVPDDPRSCQAWLAFEPKRFALEPKAGMKINCRVKPPKGTTGGYYSLFSCIGVPQSSNVESSSEPGMRATLNLSFKVLSVLMLNVTGSNVQAKVEPGPPIIDRNLDGPGYQVKIPVRNTGNTHDRVKGQVEIRSEAGQLVEQFSLESGQGYILPEQERLFTTKGAMNLPDGVYITKIQLQMTSGKALSNSFPFAVDSGLPKVAQITDEMRGRLANQSTGFIVSPSDLKMILRPGSRRSGSVELRNLTKEPIKLTMKVNEWSRDELGRDLVLDGAAPHHRSAQEYIVIKNEEIELKPLARFRVPLQIQLPKEATGETYGAVTFDRVGATAVDTPQARAVRSVMLQVEAQGTAKTAAEIGMFTAVLKPSGAMQFTVNLKNTGNIGFIPEMNYRIIDSFGNTVGRERPQSQAGMIQAGGESKITFEYGQVLNPGEYTAELTVRADPNKPPVSQTTRFTVGQSSASST